MRLSLKAMVIAGALAGLLFACVYNFVAARARSESDGDKISGRMSKERFSIRRIDRTI